MKAKKLKGPEIPFMILVDAIVDPKAGIETYSYRVALDHLLTRQAAIIRHAEFLVDHRGDGTWRATLYLGTRAVGYGRGDSPFAATEDAYENAGKE